MGRAADVTALGWSDRSLAEARERAEETLRRLVARVRAGEPFPERYAYASRPLREEIIERRGPAGGQPRAIITRNSYGSLVLNTAEVMFVDVDDPPRRVTLLGFLARLGRPRPAPALPPQLTAFMSTHPRWRIRVYRTRSGWRYLVTHDLFDPASEPTREALVSLGCDPQYVQLTRVQECFRARLTPKPWRCGAARAPGAFPRESPMRERFEKWLTRYDTLSRRYATCEFVTELGSGSPALEASRIAELHDDRTRTAAGLPLA